MSQETLLELELFLKVPAGQSEQVLEPVAMIEPNAHGLQVEAPTPEEVPGGQTEQEDEKARENEPAGQGMHVEEPDEGANDPGAQPEHSGDSAGE
jgi:hypothetical protein